MHNSTLMRVLAASCLLYGCGGHAANPQSVANAPVFTDGGKTVTAGVLLDDLADSLERDFVARALHSHLKDRWPKARAATCLR